MPVWHKSGKTLNHAEYVLNINYFQLDTTITAWVEAVLSEIFFVRQTIDTVLMNKIQIIRGYKYSFNNCKNGLPMVFAPGFKSFLFSQLLYSIFFFRSIPGKKYFNKEMLNEKKSVKSIKRNNITHTVIIFLHLYSTGWW